MPYRARTSGDKPGPALPYATPDGEASDRRPRSRASPTAP